MIRPIRKEDNLIIRDIIQTSLKSLGLDKPGTAYFDPQLGYLYEYYENIPNAMYWVIEVGGEVVGGMGIAPYDEAQKIAELQKLYLSPAAQGKGYAKQLMDEGLAYAKEHYRQVYLETTTDLVAACRLYEKYGFTLLDEPLPGSEHGAMNAWYIKDM